MNQDVVAEKRKTLEEIRREEIKIVYDLAREKKREMLALIEFSRQSVYEEVKYGVGR